MGFYRAKRFGKNLRKLEENDLPVEPKPGDGSFKQGRSLEYLGDFRGFHKWGGYLKMDGLI